MVDRLDRSQNPPGYEDCGSWFPSSDDLARAEFWRAFEEKNDPPGLVVDHVRPPVDPLQVAAHPGWWVYTSATGGLLCLFRRDDEAAARATAWAWYWRRVKLVDALDNLARQGKMHRAVGLHEPGELWPDVLTWTDDYVEQIEEAPRG